MILKRCTLNGCGWQIRSVRIVLEGLRKLICQIKSMTSAMGCLQIQRCTLNTSRQASLVMRQKWSQHCILATILPSKKMEKNVLSFRWSMCIGGYKGDGSCLLLLPLWRSRGVNTLVQVIWSSVQPIEFITKPREPGFARDFELYLPLLWSVRRQTRNLKLQNIWYKHFIRFAVPQGSKILRWVFEIVLSLALFVTE